MFRLMQSKQLDVILMVHILKECLAEYDINETVYPIGEACRKNLLVLMTLTESFYCFTDGLLLFLGGSVDEMLDCIVGECRKPIEIE